MPCIERPSGESNHSRNWRHCVLQEFVWLIDVLPAGSQTGCMTDVLHVCAFEDNYIWLIRGKSPDRVAIVDPGDADPVYGPARERIPAITQRLKEGDHIDLPELGLGFDVLDVPGHTAGHIAYYGAGMLLCGDTMFSAGCGRLFEGTAEQMLASLSRFSALPEATQMYCGHEYTEANLRFALTVEPDNADMRAHRDWAHAQRARNLPTLPSTIGLERRINPFLRSGEATVRAAAEKQTGRTLDSAVAVFAAVRRWKDDFRG